MYDVSNLHSAHLYGVLAATQCLSNRLSLMQPK